MMKLIPGSPVLGPPVIFFLSAKIEGRKREPLLAAAVTFSSVTSLVLATYHRPLIRIIEPLDQLDERRLAAATGANQRHSLPALYG